MRFLKRCHVYVPNKSLCSWWQVFNLYGRLHLELLAGPDGTNNACVIILVSLHSMIVIGKKDVF